MTAQPESLPMITEYAFHSAEEILPLLQRDELVPMELVKAAGKDSHRKARGLFERKPDYELVR